MTEQTSHETVTLAYDGRGFLAQARNAVTDCGPLATIPTYDSEGLLYQRQQQNLFTSTVTAQTRVFYFAGRPVAQLDGPAPTGVLTYLTVDHLGTPILASTGAATATWSGGFEPFGRDFTTPSAQSSGMFLRLPGQWDDAVWDTNTHLSSGLYYNVNRWYDDGNGRYEEADPIGLRGGVNPFSYVDNAPLGEVDALGLQSTTVPGNALYYICCKGGQRSVCRGPAPLPGDPFAADCEKEHEQQHLQDFNTGRFSCSPCAGKRDGTPVLVTSADKGPAECSAYCSELACLRKKAHGPATLNRIEFVKNQIKRYCAGGNCQP
jgi:RHS repeat-associated protein